MLVDDKHPTPHARILENAQDNTVTTTLDSTMAQIPKKECSLSRKAEQTTNKYCSHSCCGSACGLRILMVPFLIGLYGTHLFIKLIAAIALNLSEMCRQNSFFANDAQFSQKYSSMNQQLTQTYKEEWALFWSQNIVNPLADLVRHAKIKMSDPYWIDSVAEQMELFIMFPYIQLKKIFRDKKHV